MDVHLVETYKVLGSTAGILSAGFLIWDRAIKGRPIADVIQNLSDRDVFGNISLAVRVRNVSNKVIYITRVQSSHPDYIGVSKDHTWDDVFGNSEAIMRIMTIEPDGHRLLPLSDFPDARQGAKSVTISINWRPQLGGFSRCLPVRVKLNPDLLPGLKVPEPKKKA